MRFTVTQIWPELRKARVAILGAVSAMLTDLQTMAGSLPPLGGTSVDWFSCSGWKKRKGRGNAILQLEGNALQCLGCALHDLLSRCGRAGEGDLVNTRVSSEPGAEIVVTT